MSGWSDEVFSRLSEGPLAEGGVCLILGASDTGKSTFCELLCRRLVRRGTVGIVDADIGQSRLGPPGTVGWAVMGQGEGGVDGYDAAGIGFVGAVSPPGHLLQLTGAIVRGVRELLRVARWVVVDTPGFVTGSAACALWWAVDWLIRPAAVVAIQRAGELSELLDGLRGRVVEIVTVPEQVTTRSPQQRRQFRQERLMAYFRGARLYEIDLQKVGVQVGWKARDERMMGRLVGLRDSRGCDIAAGVVVGWVEQEVKAIIKAPPNVEVGQIASVVVGDMTVEVV